MSFSPSPFVPSLSLSRARSFCPIPGLFPLRVEEGRSAEATRRDLLPGPSGHAAGGDAAPQRGRLAGPGAARAVRALDLRGAEESLRPTRGEAPFGGREAVGAHGCTDAMHGEVKKAMTGNQFCFVFFVCSVLFLGSMAVHGRGVE